MCDVGDIILVSLCLKKYAATSYDEPGNRISFYMSKNLYNAINLELINSYTTTDGN